MPTDSSTSPVAKRRSSDRINRNASHKRRQRPAQFEQLEARRVMAAALLESASPPLQNYGIEPLTAPAATFAMPAEGEGNQARTFYYSPSVPGYVKNSNHSKLFVDDSDIVKLTVYSNRVEFAIGAI